MNTHGFHPLSGASVAHISPPPEHGVNEWCLSAARRCQLAGHSEAQTFAAIMGFSNLVRPGRTLTVQEVQRAIGTAYATPHQRVLTTSKAKPLSELELSELCPLVTEQQAQAFVLSSPLPRNLPSAEVLATLFRPDEVLAFKKTNVCRAVKCRVGELSAFFSNTRPPFQFTTSSPISGKLGLTQNGRTSFLAKPCFTSQRYVVVEFDTASPQAQFSRILWLKKLAADHAPLAMLLKSGNRSFHAWFKPDSAESAEKLKVAAVKVGADPAAMRIHQPVRCPNQMRDNGNPQEVLWLAGAPQK